MQVFDIELFREKPEIFYSVARVLSLPVDVLPSRTHTFIGLIEKHNKLLRNYTQNVDGIEDAAGITRVVRCHGTLRTASCMRCRRSVAYELIAPAIAAGRVPTCDVCISTVPTAASAVTIRAPRRAAAKKASETLTAMVPTDAITRAVLRPDIVFFREPLPSSYARTLLQDVRAADVVLVMGTSLAVAPVSSFMANLPASTPTVLINKTVVKTVHKFQYSLIGDCDTIVAQLQTRLGWHGTDVGSAMRTDP